MDRCGFPVSQPRAWRHCSAANEPGEIRQALSQLSIESPGTRENSSTLAVTKTRSSASAWAAISRSFGPAGDRCRRRGTLPRGVPRRPAKPGQTASGPALRPGGLLPCGEEPRCQAIRGLAVSAVPGSARSETNAQSVLSALRPPGRQSGLCRGLCYHAQAAGGRPLPARGPPLPAGYRPPPARSLKPPCRYRPLPARGSPPPARYQPPPSRSLKPPCRYRRPPARGRPPPARYRPPPAGGTAEIMGTSGARTQD